MRWDPDLYLTYGDERARPFVDLVSRIGADSPATVVDLGCGPGNLTALLKQRWPDADVLGIDSSAEMVAQASADGVRFEVGDLRDWRPADQVDVVVSNATLHWVPDHLERLPELASHARSWFAFQVPANFDALSHTIARDLARDPRFATHTADVVHPASHDVTDYLRVLAGAGWHVDAWETTYLHVLPGGDAVFTWVSATGVRPILESLPSDLREDFESELKEGLRAAYPLESHGTVLPFRRRFVVASR